MNRCWFLVLLCGIVSAHPKEIADSDPTNYIFSETVGSNILLPSIGNGYVSTFLFSTEVFIGGLFNGFLNIGPSHRAVIPSPLNYNISLSPGSQETLHTTGYLFNIPMGNFSAFHTVIDSNNNTVATIQQTWYAHRSFRSLIVHQITVNNTMNTNSDLKFSINNGMSEFSSPDILFSKKSPNGVAYSLYNGSINQPETLNGEKVVVAVCTTKVSPDGNNYSISPGQVFSTRYLTTFQTNIPGDSSNPATTAKSLWTEYNIISTSNLTDSHKSAWNSIWNGLGIEVEGTSDVLRLQQVTNTSLYWILSSIREDWPWSLSPGSLASNGYNGHTFWDTETWMYPTIMMLDTKLGQSILQYRINHVKGAQRKAKTYNPPYDGLMFPWEDAFSGYEVCPRGVATCRYEQHITGDIAFAFRQYWDNTHDQNWLQDNYPFIRNISLFWQSRVTQNGSVYDINDVIPPDEYAVGVNNSVYTNVVAKLSFQLAEIAAKVLGESVPSAWLDIQANLKIPFDDTRQIHLEYDGYTDEEIKQADVILLGFPLMYNMTKAIRANDLNYYSSVTNPNGPAMTWSMTAIGYIELGDYETAADYFTLGFANAQEPFQVWTETPRGGTVNFITGCGGFLQSMLFGYPSLRLHREYISITSPILPANASSITLRNLDYRGGQLNVQYDSQLMSITLNNEANSALFVIVLNSETELEYLSPSLDTLLDRAVGGPSHLQVNHPFTTSVTNSLVIFTNN